MIRFEYSSFAVRCGLGVWLLSVLSFGMTGEYARADIVWDTEMVSMDLTGGPFPLPLGSDPGNLLGDSVDGFGFVDSQVAVSLSSQRASLGGTTAWPASGSGQPDGTVPPIDPTQLDGQQFVVDSFFDVFFDITVTDVDDRPGRDFFGMPHGTSLELLDNGPARMESFFTEVFDKDASNFGLVLPPEATPFLGTFNIEVPLGGDINGNGENDKVKFTFGANAVGGQNRRFNMFPDGTVLNQFDSAALLEGVVVDASSDPPFTIGTVDPATGLPDPASFGGPTTATSRLQNPVLPEPSTLVMLSMGAVGLAGYLWRKRRRG